MINKRLVNEAQIAESLFDLLKFAADLKGNYAIYIEAESGEEGILHCAQGVISNAAVRNLEGKEALEEIISWQHCGCRLEELRTSPVKKMNLSLKRLLKKLKRGGLSSKRNKTDSSPAPGGIEPKNNDRNSSVASSTNTDSKSSSIDKTLTTKKEDLMPSQAQTIIEAAAREINGLVACQLVGTDGIAVAEVNPAGAPTDAYSAKFALVMTLVSKTLADVGGGKLEENLVQHNKGWFLTRFVGKGEFFLGVAVDDKAVLGNVRMVAKQLSEQLASVVG